MKKFKFILAVALLVVTLIGTVKLIPTVSKTMLPDPNFNIGDFDDEGVYPFSHQPSTQDK